MTLETFQLADSANEGVTHFAGLLKIEHFPTFDGYTVDGGPRGLSQGRGLLVRLDLDNRVRD